MPGRWNAMVQRISSTGPDRCATSVDPVGRGLFDTRYASLASNTIDYWMLPDDLEMTERRVWTAIENAPVLDDASLQIYLHVPFCAQRCRFCAFSGGNALNFEQAERYSRLVVLQVRDLLERSQVSGHPIRSVNVGGGSPDLVGEHIGYILEAMRNLPGCSDDTEFSVEFTLSTTSRAFIDHLVRHNVTKASFGIQSLDRAVRRHMRQPPGLQHLERVLGWIDGRIPAVNADLITGLPGQSLRTVQDDLHALMDDPRINCISSYLLTPGAAPSLLAGLATDELPALPGPAEQAMMRLHTYNTFLRHGWVRRGTNTYVNPDRLDTDALERIAGNECIGASNYEAFLIGAGPQAVSYMPGARIENNVTIEQWMRAMESGEHPFCLPKCNDVAQKDTALWVFPLRWESLPRGRFERMIADDALTPEQLATLEAFEREGLVIQSQRGYELSILGEVFMGHLVHDFKQTDGRRAVDEYIAEGHALGRAISGGAVSDSNDANNRQIALKLLHEDRAQDG